MQKTVILFLLVLAATACNNPKGGYEKPEDAEEAGTTFIRAALNGDYEKASHYLLKDSVNNMILEKWKTDSYDKLSNADRVSYTEANILPIKIEPVNDSTVTYVFTNTFKNKDTTTIQIVKVNGEWLVDLKNIH